MFSQTKFHTKNNSANHCFILFTSIGKTRTREKYRSVYSELQRHDLEQEFAVNKYISIKRKTELARQLALSERQIKIWFQNRRAKDRRHQTVTKKPMDPYCQM